MNVSAVLLNWLDLEWTDVEDQPMDDTTLRHVQLGVRLAEVDGGQGLVSTGRTSSLCWEATKPIIAGRSFGGSLVMVAAADHRLNFSHGWILGDKTIPAPLLAINSEEYATGTGFAKLLAIAPCMGTHAIYVIPGATHPPFSDVFLILPDNVNKWIGQVADPWHIVWVDFKRVGRKFGEMPVSKTRLTDDDDGLSLF
ncbi:hypothetical protein EV363DRAFT_1456330 [Boletus edulis]|nr:hypothetical protein EV363DRAFT_1456330 [Boletus edulis]